jgi:hypothetical protein
MGLPQQPKRAQLSGSTLSRTGVIGPLIAFLDRNLLRFSQPVRDTIGIGFLILVAAYFLNGLIGSTYVRGELWVQSAGDKHRGEGWQVTSGENQAVVNHSGFWTLPVYGNGIPGVIRLIVDDDGRDDKGQRRAPRTVGVVKVYGPWPVWNTFQPMNSVEIDVDLDRRLGQQVTLAKNSPRLFKIDTIYAQSKAALPIADTSQLPGTVVTVPSLPCALALKQIGVIRFPGFFRSAGRAYFEMKLDGKVIPDNFVLYGPGLGSIFGQFPVPGHKELWLPVQTGSNDRYSGIYANLSGIADCEAYVWRPGPYALTADQTAAILGPVATTDGPRKSEGTKNSPTPPVKLSKIPAKGRVELVMKSDGGNVLNRFDLSAALAAPGQEVVLSGDPQGKATIAVMAIANHADSKGFVVTTEVTSGDRLQKTVLVIGQPERSHNANEQWRFGYELLGRSHPDDFFVTRVKIDLAMASDSLSAAVQAKAANTALNGLKPRQAKYVLGELAAAARTQAARFSSGQGFNEKEWMNAFLGLFK